MCICIYMYVYISICRHLGTVEAPNYDPEPVSILKMALLSEMLKVASANMSHGVELRQPPGKLAYHYPKKAQLHSPNHTKRINRF